MSRESIFQALFALGQAITWDDPVTGQPTTWRTMQRRIQTPDQIGSDAQPAFMQADANEAFAQVRGLPSKRTMAANWVIFLKAYDAPQPTSPLINTVLDAVELALQPDQASDTCTLGGQANHVWIEGEAFKDPGDLDGQALIIVPIRILVP